VSEPVDPAWFAVPGWVRALFGQLDRMEQTMGETADALQVVNEKLEATRTQLGKALDEIQARIGELEARPDLDAADQAALDALRSTADNLAAAAGSLDDVVPDEPAPEEPQG